MSAVYHGGDLSKASARFGMPPDGWIDLSTGINPRPWPMDGAGLADLTRLPDTDLLDRLTDAAAAAYGVSSGRRIAAAPGTQALIQWLPRLRPPGRVAILSPTYGEHAAAWRLGGHEVTEVSALPSSGTVDVVVVTRPNNPDGASADADSLLSLASILAKKGGLLVIDEAFADLDSGPSLAAEAEGGLIALRSFGKFYGLPGLRLGFAVTDPGTAASIVAALGPWPVSSLAARVGAEALSDHAWQTETRDRLAQAARRMDSILTGAGFEIVGGTDLYRLADSAEAQAIHEELGHAGIYTRPFEDHPRWLRFGLPGTEAHWDRLVRALEP